MKTRCLLAMLLAVHLLLGTASVVWAHVRVLPEEVPADGFEVFTVRVPNEKEVPTTEVRVEVPEGFTVSRVEPVYGWDYELEEEAGAVKAITWSGGEIGETEFRQFDIQGRTPAEPGEYAWNAYQTYADGEVVEWIGPAGSEEEASVVTVVEGGSGEGGHGTVEQEESASEPSATTGEIIPVAAYGGLGLGALALIVALVALLRGRKA
jgi:uncharacterized protein YcnI